MAAGKKSPAGARLSAARGKVRAAVRERQTAQAPADPEVRMEKIEKVREAVQRGEYKVPASKIAAKILDEMRRR